MKDRLSLRRAPDAILRIRIEPNNDAIVLNISDGGLSFRALKPVMPSGTVHFSYFDNGQRMDADAPLVWLDAARLTGGLSFASLPRLRREQFQNWVAQSPSKEYPLPGAEMPPRQAAGGSPGALPNFSPAEPGMPGFALMDQPQPGRYGWDPEMRYPGPPSSRFFPGFVTGLVVTAIALVALFFFYGNSADALRDEIRQSAGLSPTPQIAPPVAPATPAPLPPATSPSSASGAPAFPGTAPTSAGTNMPPAPAPPLPNPGDNSPADNSAANPAPPAAAEQPPQRQADNQKPGSATRAPRKAAPAGEDDLAVAQRYLSAMPGPEGRQRATQFLWSAVEKGNLKAEITLANLYSRGDGVTKNCAQARVLLRAAAEKGSAEASQQLAQLIRTGCS